MALHTENDRSTTRNKSHFSIGMSQIFEQKPTTLCQLIQVYKRQLETAEHRPTQHPLIALLLKNKIFNIFSVVSQYYYYYY